MCVYYCKTNAIFYLQLIIRPEKYFNTTGYIGLSDRPAQAVHITALAYMKVSVSAALQPPPNLVSPAPQTLSVIHRPNIPHVSQPLFHQI